MTRIFPQLLLFGAMALLAAAAAAAATLTGTVRNATKGAPAAGVDVVLLQLQGGMEEVASTKTDAQGRFRLEHPGVGRQPMLVRVSYRGVNFHQSLPPGRETVELEVFEPTADPGVLQVASRVIVLQPNGPVLLVGEEYAVQNRSNPPAAFYKADGSFEFQVPEGGELAQVSAWGPSGMPVVQSTMDRGPRRFAIAFAFRPGESGVRLSYQVPYSSNQATLHLVSPYALARVFVLAPPAMQASGAGFQPAGNEQGMNLYAHDAVAAGAVLDLSVSGTAPPPAAAAQQEPRGRDAGLAVQALPNRLDALKWVLIGGFGALFVLGLAFLWRRPAPASMDQPPVPAKPEAARRKAPDESGVRVSAAAVEVERHVQRSLDDLKDALFRLELRRQAGTVSEDEYARERSRAEKLLRDLVKD